MKIGDSPLTGSIGRFTVAMSIAEGEIDACNDLLFENFGGNQTYPAIPISWKRKSLFFERVICASDKLADFHSKAKEIAEDFAKHADFRTWIIHGSDMDGLAPNATKGRFFRVYPGPKTKFESRIIEKDEIDMEALGAMAMTLMLSAFRGTALSGKSFKDFQDRLSQIVGKPTS